MKNLTSKSSLEDMEKLVSSGIDMKVVSCAYYKNIEKEIEQKQLEDGDGIVEKILLLKAAKLKEEKEKGKKPEAGFSADPGSFIWLDEAQFSHMCKKIYSWFPSNQLIKTESQCNEALRSMGIGRQINSPWLEFEGEEALENPELDNLKEEMMVI